MTTVLLVEDDPDLRRLVARGLEEEGFEVSAARTGSVALEQVRVARPDLLVVDIGLPDTDGRDLCQAMRASGMNAPVLFLTARDSGADRVSGFGAGGDDYLTKPFVFAELVARLRALARRTVSSTPVTIGDLQLDPVGHSLVTGGNRAALTPTEFRLFGVLISGQGGVVRRREMTLAAWPAGAIVHDNTVDVYVRRLRRKLEEIESQTKIETVHGVGYRLV
jgi:two-component system response regulator MprA